MEFTYLEQTNYTVFSIFILDSNVVIVNYFQISR